MSYYPYFPGKQSMLKEKTSNNMLGLEFQHTQLQHLSIPNESREKGAELALLLSSSTCGNQSPLIPLFMLEGGP